MVGEGLFLVSHGFSGGFYGGSLGNFLLQLEQLGFFTYVLPFLILFAIIFGVLSRVQIFGTGKPIYVIISLAVSLMAIQFGFVSQFFSEIFPRLGIWLAVILIIFIIMGLMSPSGKWNHAAMVLVGIVILTVILVQTFGVTWYTGYWFSRYWPGVLAAIIILVALGAIVSNTPEGQPLTFGSFARSILNSSSYGPQQRP